MRWKSKVPTFSRIRLVFTYRSYWSNISITCWTSVTPMFFETDCTLTKFVIYLFSSPCVQRRLPWVVCYRILGESNFPGDYIGIICGFAKLLQLPTEWHTYLGYYQLHRLWVHHSRTGYTNLSTEFRLYYGILYHRNYAKTGKTLRYLYLIPYKGCWDAVA